MSERRIVLDKATYYELVALGERREKARLDMELAATRLARAAERVQSALAALAIAHTFSERADIRTEDDGCVLIVSESA